MARFVNKRPAWAGRTAQFGRRGLYPWTEWIQIPKGKTEQLVVLKQGQDYNLKTETFRQACYAAARRLGFDITTTVKKDKTEILLTLTKRKG